MNNKGIQILQRIKRIERINLAALQDYPFHPFNLLLIYFDIYHPIDCDLVSVLIRLSRSSSRFNICEGIGFFSGPSPISMFGFNSPWKSDPPV